MTSTEDDGPSSTLPRRQLGRFLRERREAAGFTIAEAAKLVDLSRAVLQRIETGQIQKVRRQDVAAMCQVYDVGDDETQAAVDLAAQARSKSWHHVYGGLYGSAFNMYVGLESAARRLTTCHDQHIPGLLQTADYARAIIDAFPSFTNPEDVDRRVEHRLKRQALVTRKTNPVELDVLLHASVLYRMIGGSTTMAGALRHLAEISKRPNIAIRIQPFSAGLTWGIPHGSFIILDFGATVRKEPVEPPVVFIEGGAAQDVYLEKPEEIRLYSELAAAIRGTCLGEVESRSLLRQVAKEYERGEH
ncbi:helix-turn-helix domain-containing protein [Nocardia sp. SYP-A9097]|uniref:helix-turn-helix domain-containing protein n=1 Tax=Nocardia sp. SYP-A9097 TaxID=2663237 RepID=UPI00129A49A9|nr:helix-turn-helix transcriptional regulator [Nocardia sp. SYP-A9097]MRH89507.1 helix-turn-helix domain-containing protein [Nocardia sp. SYP-A9097]